MHQHYNCFGIVLEKPKLLVTERGEKYARLALAVPYNHQRNNWIPVTLRKKTAEYACEMLEKGATVYISGYLLMVAKTGKTRAYLRVYCTYFKVVCRPRDGRNVPVLPHDDIKIPNKTPVKIEEMADQGLFLDIELPWEK